MAKNCEARARYGKQFPDDGTKMRTFDELVEHYYFKKYEAEQAMRGWDTYGFCKETTLRAAITVCC